jgi:hypothetical protein
MTKHDGRYYLQYTAPGNLGRPDHLLLWRRGASVHSNCLTMLERNRLSQPLSSAASIGSTRFIAREIASQPTVTNDTSTDVALCEKKALAFLNFSHYVYV